MAWSPASRPARTIAADDGPRRCAAGRGFTIVELLVVVGIIALLVAVIVPTAGRIRAAALDVQCGSNQRQLAQAFIAFAADNGGRLPGNFFDGGQPDPRRRSWLINNNEPLDKAPQGGTLWKYVNNAAVYRCPALDVMPLGSGSGSNGRFDYVSFLGFTGARLSKLSGAQARFTYSDGKVVDGLAVPLILEEEPLGGLNGGNPDCGHSNIDRMSHNHRGGSNYAAADGSVRWFLEPWEANAMNWSAQAPSGRWVPLGTNEPIPRWGWWDGQ